MLAPGTYVLTSTLYFNGAFNNVGIRGATDNRDDVVLIGPGMAQRQLRQVPFGIWTGSGVNGITIANLTIRDLYYHPIIFNAGTQNPRIYNVHLIDAGQQFIKSNPDGLGGGVDNGIVEYSVIEFTTHGDERLHQRHRRPRPARTGSSGTTCSRTSSRRPASWPGRPCSCGTARRTRWSKATRSELCPRHLLRPERRLQAPTRAAASSATTSSIASAAQPGDVGDSWSPIRPTRRSLNNTVYRLGHLPSADRVPLRRHARLSSPTISLDGPITSRDGATATLTHQRQRRRARRCSSTRPAAICTSPRPRAAIDHGTALAEVTDDWDGQARPQGAAYDIGADEFGGAVATYRIAGRVVDSAGTGLSGVTLTLSGGQSNTATTDASGDFSFTGLAGAVDYTVTPSKASVTFSPASAFYSKMSGSQMATDFKAFSETANTPPVVSVSANGSTFTAPATIVVSATASDPDGTIRHGSSSTAVLR